MKLYLDPAATTCRGVTLFAAEHDLQLDMIHVDLFGAAHLSPEFTAVNPNQCVPVLEHDGFRLTESAAILRYLATVTDSPTYPRALQARARVDEALDWFNTGLYRDLGYGVVYPQVLPQYRREHPAAQADVVARGHERGGRWLRLLDQRLASQDGRFVCGAEISLADYLGSAYVTLAEITAFDFGPYPFVRKWLQTMRSRPAWDEVNAAFYGWRSAALSQLGPELKLTA
jgi:glutathione S-transferase